MNRVLDSTSVYVEGESQQHRHVTVDSITGRDDPSASDAISRVLYSPEHHTHVQCPRFLFLSDLMISMVLLQSAEVPHRLTR